MNQNESIRRIGFLTIDGLKEFMIEECLKPDQDSNSTDVLLHPEALTENFVRYGLYDNLDLIGFAVVEIKEDTVSLARLYVTPSKRRTGAGTLLLEAAKPTHLCCYSKNERALSFYKELGFKIITPEDSFFHILENVDELATGN